MLSSLISRIRMSPPVRWLARMRRNLFNFWFLRETENLLFFSLFGLVIVLIGSAVYFVYVDHLRIRWQQQRQADLMCLARNVYHEARGESDESIVKHAWTIVWRVKRDQFPDNLCAVIFQRGKFSAFNRGIRLPARRCAGCRRRPKCRRPITRPWPTAA